MGLCKISKNQINLDLEIISILYLTSYLNQLSPLQGFFLLIDDDSQLVTS